MINGYKEHGKAFFVHGNKELAPAHTLESSIKNLILDLYRNKYWEANFEHFQELLAKYEDIYISMNAVRKVLMEVFILSPKANRATKKDARKQLESIKASGASKKEITAATNSIVALENAHPRKSRCAYFGEMLQMDASVHHWFGPDKAHLHIAVDDATGRILGAYFNTQETLPGYYNVFRQILRQ